MQGVNSSSIWMNASRTKRQQAYTKVDRVQGAMFKYIFFLILLAFFCSLFYIWSRIQVVNIGYEINRSLGLKEKLIEENKKLTLEAATLKSPVRLESLAHNQFQMDLPQKSQILNQRVMTKPVQLASISKPAPKIPTKTIAQTKNQKSITPTAQKSKIENNLKSTKKPEMKQSLKVASVAAAGPSKR